MRGTIQGKRFFWTVLLFTVCFLLLLEIPELQNVVCLRTLAPLPASSKNSSTFSSSPEHAAKRQDELVISVITSAPTSFFNATERLSIIHPFLTEIPRDDNWNVTILYVTNKGGILPGYERGIFLETKCGDGQQKPVVCKLVFMYKYILKNHPFSKWVMRVTDDTYVNVPNLVSFVRKFNPVFPWYIGEVYEHSGARYADGGVGWLLSRGALEKVAPELDRYWKILLAQGNWYDDVSFGTFLRDHLHMHLVQGSGFHNENLKLHGCEVQSECNQWSQSNISCEAAHAFHMHMHGKLLGSRLVSYHLRIGKQAGGGTSTGVDIKWANKLHQMVTFSRDALPVLNEEDVSKEHPGRF